MKLNSAKTVTIPGVASRPAHTHLFDADSIDAIDAALAAGRPLLVYGEPGIGKSQLALAAALHLGWAFVSLVIDAHSESRDLLWDYDAVARLAEAQLRGAMPTGGGDEQGLAERMAIERYIRPGPLWWAFNWNNARGQADRAKAPIPVMPDAGSDRPRCDPERGCVLLIDEIDKAESDVPNGLLEALGAGRFPVQGLAGPVVSSGRPTLVVISSNKERALPDAFIRRCLVLHLGLPDVIEQREAFIACLVERGRAHFDGQAGDKLLTAVAGQLADDREAAQQGHWLPLPGQAEYLDLVAAVRDLAGPDWEAQEPVLRRIGRFLLHKHPDAARHAAKAKANEALAGGDDA